MKIIQVWGIVYQNRCMHKCVCCRRQRYANTIIIWIEIQFIRDLFGSKFVSFENHLGINSTDLRFVWKNQLAKPAGFIYVHIFYW